jgi:hypothetical protein
MYITTMPGRLMEGIDLFVIRGMSKTKSYIYEFTKQEACARFTISGMEPGVFLG